MIQQLQIVLISSSCPELKTSLRADLPRQGKPGMKRQRIMIIRHLFTSGVLEHGYGKQLYRATETRICQSLVENLVLWVFEKNTRARSFYEAVGYRYRNWRYAIGSC